MTFFQYPAGQVEVVGRQRLVVGSHIVPALWQSSALSGHMVTGSSFAVTQQQSRVIDETKAEHVELPDDRILQVEP